MKNEMSFKKAIKLAEDIIERFEKIERRKWGAEGSLIELQKQVGELSKLVMIYEKYYFSNRDKTDKQYKANKEKIWQLWSWISCQSNNAGISKEELE